MKKKVFDLDKCETNEKGELVCPELPMPEIDDSPGEAVKEIERTNPRLGREKPSPSDKAEIV